MAIQLTYPIAHYRTGDPVPYRTQKFGNPTNYGTHEGVDYAAYVGQPVWAAKAGKVVRVKYDMSTYHAYGIHCWVNHGNEYWTAYCHLSRLDTQLDQLVQAGDVLGLAGSTGNSTGPHLHWNLTLNGKYLDPEKYLVGAAPEPIPPDATSIYIPNTALRIRREPSVKAVLLATISAGTKLYTTGKTATTDDGYQWVELASDQRYRGIDISKAWCVERRTEVKTFGIVSLLE